MSRSMVMELMGWPKNRPRIWRMKLDGKGDAVGVEIPMMRPKEQAAAGMWRAPLAGGEFYVIHQPMGPEWNHLRRFVVEVSDEGCVATNVKIQRWLEERAKDEGAGRIATADNAG